MAENQENGLMRQLRREVRKIILSSYALCNLAKRDAEFGDAAHAIG